MGQAQSEMAEAPIDPTQSSNLPPPSSSGTPDNSQRSLDSLIAEAAAYGDDENESLDAKAQKALDCPCIADLRNGSCGAQFSEAFLCFLKSTAEEKGSDCIHPFVALQNCIKDHPDAFSKDVLEEDVKKEEETVQEYRIIPPSWSRESPTPKSKSKL
ncbi:mitochondrial intermembrane space import and assembly protein 40 homolog [Euphorbia lathyris]|uniref:mitochondrial intermembrane space import and assembly protein 40 homolog n=1 Tax=Euphorbia lathyris TaxID=212925 RepID=UPI003313E848